MCAVGVDPVTRPFTNPVTFAVDVVPPITSQEQVASFLSGWGQDIWDTGDFVTEPIVARSAAISVPSVAAGRDLIVNTLAPLELRLLKGDVEQTKGGLLQRPDPRFTRFEWMAWVLDDLIFEGECICQVTNRGWDGYPLALERLDPTCITKTDTGIRDVDGCMLPTADLVRFGAGTDGIRWSGRRIIRTALRLEQAARQDAETPIPALILQNTGPDMSSTEITDLLTAWRTARSATKGGVGYLNASLDAKEMGWSAAERQLVEGRRHVSVEIARLLGLDASDLDAAQAGSSITYQNTVSQVRNRLQRLAGYRAAVEQRFSMPDLTPRGYTVSFDTDEIATDEMATRYQAYSTAIAAGFLTVDEVRAREGLDPNPAPTPAPTVPTPGGAP